MLLRKRLPYYAYLMRLDKPIGILLLLWPTLWALWLAGAGQPDRFTLAIFVAGVFLMRSAGCVVNDFADRHFDGFVSRTRSRPLPSGKVTTKEALVLAAALLLVAFVLVLFCNPLTIALSLLGAVLAVIYPFLKRVTHLPQLGLGLAFTWGVPMAFAAQTGTVSVSAWFLFFTGLIWPISYDTIYAMADREDDRKIGVKSTAILFNELDKFLVGMLQLLFLALLVITGLMFRLHAPFYLSLIVVAALFGYQQWLIKDRNPQQCIQAFRNNNWVGMTVFIGILLSYLQ